MTAFCAVLQIQKHNSRCLYLEFHDLTVVTFAMVFNDENNPNSAI